MNKIKKHLVWIDRQVIKHFILLTTASVGIIFSFIYIFLPLYTRHGVSITVPDFRNHQVDEILPLLQKNKLRYAIRDDRSFNENLAPGTIISQEPMPGSRVKVGRTIYFSTNSDRPPLVSMPNLLNGSFRNAFMVLKNYGLRVGVVRYRADIAKNAVLNQKYEGNDINPGDRVPRGSAIDLVIGAGLGKKIKIMPTLIGLSREDAMVSIKKLGLVVGSIILTEPKEDNYNSVEKHFPQPGTKVRRGQLVDLWISKSPNVG